MGLGKGHFFLCPEVGRYGCQNDGLDEANMMVRVGGGGGKKGGREQRKDGEHDGPYLLQTLGGSPASSIASPSFTSPPFSCSGSKSAI